MLGLSLRAYESLVNIKRSFRKVQDYMSSKELGNGDKPLECHITFSQKKR